jgi:hypothetical protein
MAEEAQFLNDQLQGHTLDVLRQLVTGSSELDAIQQQKYIDNASIEELDLESTYITTYFHACTHTHRHKHMHT